MKLLTSDGGYADGAILDWGEPATLDDIKAWAKGMDLAVVPLEPTEETAHEISMLWTTHWRTGFDLYKAMIEAAQNTPTTKLHQG